MSESALVRGRAKRWVLISLLAMVLAVVSALTAPWGIEKWTELQEWATYGRHAAKVQFDVKALSSCVIDTRITNRSQRTIEYISFQIRGRRPNRSGQIWISGVGRWGAPEITSDWIIKPDEELLLKTDTCQSGPLLLDNGTVDISELLKLELSVDNVRLTFSE